MKRKKPIIAVAQIRYFDIAKKNNVEKIKKYIRLAKKSNADIICFPESCVHKHEILHPEHKFIKEIREECKKNSIWCIITEDIELNGRFHNSAMLINREGNIVGHYNKIKLCGDRKMISPGKEIKVFKTDFGKIGMAICWDLAFPEIFKEMKKQGAEIIFCPVSWDCETKVYESEFKKKEIALMRSLISARAFENLFFLALCSPVYNSKVLMSYSAISSPHEILKEIVDKEGLLVSELNLNEIKKLHKIYR
jgi:predicted amidohydrolase